MKRVKCQSGIMGYECKLQENYEGNFETFEYYCETYGIHTRLGYSNPLKAWDENPTIQGSVNPEDLRVVK